ARACDVELGEALFDVRLSARHFDVARERFFDERREAVLERALFLCSGERREPEQEHGRNIAADAPTMATGRAPTMATLQAPPRATTHALSDTRFRHVSKSEPKKIRTSRSPWRGGETRRRTP